LFCGVKTPLYCRNHDKLTLSALERV